MRAQRGQIRKAFQRECKIEFSRQLRAHSEKYKSLKEDWKIKKKECTNRANINDFKRGQKIGQTRRGHLKRTREVTKSRAR